MPTTILLTGFEPFGNTPVNPAERVAKLLDGSRLGEADIVSRIVPSSFFQCIDCVTKAIAEVQPDVVLMLGEYSGRATITVERLAQNLNDGARYNLADNAGAHLQDVLTVEGGPAAIYTTVPLRAMVVAMRDAGIPADISDAAGTFCCNHLHYGILHHVAEKKLPVRVGWIHLPRLPEVAALPENLGQPSMSLDTAAAGVRVALQAILDNPTDCSKAVSGRLQI
jgi:pyroglutamyl-peptidase